VEQNIDAYIRKETIASIIINVVINMLIIWFLKKDGGPIFTDGEQGYEVDIILTTFLLFFILSLIVIPIQRSRRKSGDVPKFRWDRSLQSHRVIERFPRSVWLSSFIFGITALVIFAPITLLVLTGLGIGEFSPLHYTIFKGVWVAIMVVILVPSILRFGIAK
jgi:predicted ABC-type exoprotein transport system permease subunit